jgi:hypothetical protein
MHCVLLLLLLLLLLLGFPVWPYLLVKSGGPHCVRGLGLGLGFHQSLLLLPVLLAVLLMVASDVLRLLLLLLFTEHSSVRERHLRRGPAGCWLSQPPPTTTSTSQPCINCQECVMPRSLSTPATL